MTNMFRAPFNFTRRDGDQSRPDGGGGGGRDAGLQAPGPPPAPGQLEEGGRPQDPRLCLRWEKIWCTVQSKCTLYSISVHCTDSDSGERWSGVTSESAVMRVVCPLSGWMQCDPVWSAPVPALPWGPCPSVSNHSHSASEIVSVATRKDYNRRASPSLHLSWLTVNNFFRSCPKLSSI